jgi:hypothetical protein
MVGCFRVQGPVQCTVKCRVDGEREEEVKTMIMLASSYLLKPKLHNQPRSFIRIQCSLISIASQCHHSIHRECLSDSPDLQDHREVSDQECLSDSPDLQDHREVLDQAETSTVSEELDHLDRHHHQDHNSDFRILEVLLHRRLRLEDLVKESLCKLLHDRRTRGGCRLRVGLRVHRTA